MIQLIPHGDVFWSEDSLIVIPTNLVGVMGAGLASQVKSASLACFTQYQKACRNKTHTLDDPLLVSDAYHRFLCVATKKQWQADSTMEDITRGVRGLVKWLNTHPEELAVSVPLLGGGLGNRFKKNDRGDIVELLLRELQHMKYANVYLCV